MLNTDLYPVEIASAYAVAISETEVEDPEAEQAEAAIAANELPRSGSKEGKNGSRPVRSS